MPRDLADNSCLAAEDGVPRDSADDGIPQSFEYSRLLPDSVEDGTHRNSDGDWVPQNSTTIGCLSTLTTTL